MNHKQLIIAYHDCTGEHVIFSYDVETRRVYKPTPASMRRLNNVIRKMTAQGKLVVYPTSGRDIGWAAWKT